MNSRRVCLAVLSLGDASGYEIRKSLESGPIGKFTDAGFGSIYPALRRLRDEGLILGKQEAQESRPDKTVYSITQKGKLALLDALAESPGAERLRSDYMVRLFFAHLLPARTVEHLIDDRIAFYHDKIAHMRDVPSCTGSYPGADFVRGFGRALYEAGARYLEDHKHELLAAIAIDGELDEQPGVGHADADDAGVQGARIDLTPTHHNFAADKAAE